MIIFVLRGCGGCERPKTSYFGAHLVTLTQRSVHPSAPILLTKDSPRNFISYESQPPFSLYISKKITLRAEVSKQRGTPYYTEFGTRIVYVSETTSHLSVKHIQLR